MKYWGKLAAFWGGLWGFLVGSAFFWIPGIGPIAVAGPVASWIVGALEGAAIGGGMSALAAAFFSIGIPVVTDVDWIRTSIKVFGFAVHGHVRVFADAELSDAKQWLSE